MQKEENKKLYLVGIDSAPLWIIKDLAKKGKMEGFELFLEDDSLFDIESTVPPVTSVAWPTIYTGLEPKQHGIIDFSSINKNYEKELLYYDSLKNPPFWDILASKGYSCLVVTPAVALRKSIHKNVDMLTGWPLSPRYSSRRIEEICKKFGYDGEPDIGNALNTEKMTLKEATKIYKESTKKRADISRYLIDRNDYDVAFVCFTETDRIQHYSLNLKNWADYVAPVYEEISEFIKYLNLRAERLGEQAMIMIVSDHGAQHINHKFLSNSWMVQNKYATLKEDIYKKDVQKKGSVVSNVKSKIVDKLVESKIRREIYTRMPRSIQKLGESFVEESFDYESKGKYVRIKESDFDMKKTKAFCSVSFGPMGMIWINDSRFATPNVGKEERDKLKKEIIGNFKKIKDVNGKLLIKNIYEGYSYFSKDENVIPPDIVFELEDGYTSDYSGYSKNSIYTEPEINRRGEHTRVGVFGIKSYRKDIDLEGLSKRSLSLSDVCPTILRYYGISSQGSGKSMI